MEHCRTKSSLSKERRRLLDEMQRINFGRIEGLVVRNGEPVFDPPPCIVYDVKFGGENGSRPESSVEDFYLKSEVLELFDYFSSLKNGTIQSLEIKHGLPLLMKVQELTSCKI